MPKDLTVGNFQQEVINSREPVLVDFWAEWCFPCKALGPIFNELEKEYSGKAKFCKVNIESEESLAVDFSITSIPTVLAFKNGEIVHRIEGLRAKKEFVKTIVDITGENIT